MALLLPHRVAQNLAQPSMRAEEPQAHSDRRDPQARGYFVRGILQDVAQQTDLAQVRREERDGTGQQHTLLAAGVAVFGIVGARGEPAAEGVLGGHPRLFERDVLPFAALADQVDRSIRRDARHPGVEVILAVVLLSCKLVKAGKRFQEGFLAGIFGVGRIACQAQGPPVESRPVRQDHFSEGLAIAEPGVGQNLALGGTGGFASSRGKIVGVRDYDCGAHVEEQSRTPRATLTSL